MITYDMEFPEQARILAIKGEQLILILDANMIPYQTYQHIYLCARAMENHVFIAATNKVGLEKGHCFFFFFGKVRLSIQLEKHFIYLAIMRN